MLVMLVAFGVAGTCFVFVTGRIRVGSALSGWQDLGALCVPPPCAELRHVAWLNGSTASVMGKFRQRDATEEVAQSKWLTRVIRNILNRIARPQEAIATDEGPCRPPGR